MTGFWDGVVRVVRRWGRYIDQNPPPPKILGTISSTDIFNLMPKDYHNPYNDTDYKVRSSLWDSDYKLTSVDEIKRFLAWDMLDTKKYEPQYFDCDDFAACLWGRMKDWAHGYAIGLIITIKPNHAKNVFVDHYRKVWEIEPQSDVIRPLGDNITQYIF